MAKSFEQILGRDMETLSGVGIYKIYHQARPERLYIGSASKYKSQRKFSHHGFYRRWYEHYRHLQRGEHSSKYLQNTINKHGIEGVVFEIIEHCNGKAINEIREREQFYIDTLKPVYNCFNTVHPQGRVWTKQERKTLSKKRKGIALPNKVYEKIKKSVYQQTPEGIVAFNSVEEASRSTKIDRASISKCASGKRNTAGGYKWSWTKL